MRAAILPPLISLFLMTVSGCQTEPKVIFESDDYQTASHQDYESLTQRLYIVSNGSHIGVIVTAEDLNQRLPQLSQYFPENTTHYEIGWGDADYYQTSDAHSGLAVQAFFWPTSTVLHVISFAKKPTDYAGQRKMHIYHIDAAAKERLLTYMANSFDQSRQPLKPLAPGHFKNSQFYQATGKYYLNNNCNKWAAKAMKSAGVPINPTFVLTADGVMEHAPK